MVVYEPIGMTVHPSPTTETKQLVIISASHAVQESNLLGRLAAIVLKKVKVMIVHGSA